MKHRRRSVLLLLPIVLLAASTALARRGSEQGEIVGTWRGTSLCVDRIAAPACQDEQVIYDIVPTPGKPNTVTVNADKIVDGKRVPMGPIDISNDGKTEVWATEFRTGQQGQVVFRLTLSGSRLQGTMMLLPSKAVVRKIELQKAELKVLSAIGMRQVMLDLTPKFERAIGYKLAITFDSTGVMAKRVASGEQVDVVLLNQSAVAILEKDGQVTASSVTPVAASVAAVAIRRGAARLDISSPEAFRRMLLSAKSIARPSPSVGGSSGDHIAKVLEQLGIADQVNAKSVIVMTGIADQVADSPGAAVAQGKADVALHQLQELMAVPGLEIVGPFPGELQGSFMFSAALGTTAKEGEGGKALIAFLLTPAARDVIKAKGMEPPHETRR